jgi:hypothetical protein
VSSAPAVPTHAYLSLRPRPTIDQEWEVSNQSASSDRQRYIKANISTWRVAFVAIFDLCCCIDQPIKAMDWKTASVNAQKELFDSTLFQRSGGFNPWINPSLILHQYLALVDY